MGGQDATFPSGRWSPPSPLSQVSSGRRRSNSFARLEPLIDTKNSGQAQITPPTTPSRSNSLPRVSCDISPKSAVGRMRGSFATASMPDIKKPIQKVHWLREMVSWDGFNWDGRKVREAVQVKEGKDEIKLKRPATTSKLAKLSSNRWLENVISDGYKWDGRKAREPSQVKVEKDEIAPMKQTIIPQLLKQNPQEKKSRDGSKGHGRKPCEPLQTKEEKDEPAPVKQKLPCVWVHDKHETYVVDMPEHIQGGPTAGEAFALLMSGSDSLPNTELQRMYCFFCRFMPTGMSEVSKEDLPHLLILLNYFVPDQALVHRLAQRFSPYAFMDFNDFERFTRTYAEVEREMFRTTYDVFDTEKKRQVPCTMLPAIMKKLGTVILKTTIDEILASSSLKESTSLSFRDFLQFLALYKARGGFGPPEILKLKQIFTDRVTPTSECTGTPSLQACRVTLSAALMQAFGAHARNNLEHLLEHTIWDSTKSSPISLHEFVMWAHCLQGMELRKLHQNFCAADTDTDGLVSIREMRDSLKKAGFTLLCKEVAEILLDIGKSHDTRFDFCSFVSFVKVCQHRCGFSSNELHTLRDAYKKHDHGSGIGRFELADLIRYLGYEINMQDVSRYMKQVGCNGDGSMDFLKIQQLMRIHREEQLSRFRKVFESNADIDDGTLDADDLEIAYEELGCNPCHEHIQCVLDQIGNPETLEFEDFVHAVDALREKDIIRKRQRAGFSDTEFELISKLFEKHISGGSAKLEKGNLILLLIDAGVPMNCAEKRAQVFEMWNEARNQALTSGMALQDIGRASSPRLTFWPFVHLLRAVLKTSETSTNLREDQAVVETGFDRREVDEFRDQFLECAHYVAHGDGPIRSGTDGFHADVGISPKPGSRKSHRRATISGFGNMTWTPGVPQKQVQLQVEPNKTLKELLDSNAIHTRVHVKSIRAILSRKLGLHFSIENREAMECQVRELSAKHDDSVDFPDFLRLMRWMLNTNFAKINDIASVMANEVNKAKEEAAMPGVVSSCDAVKFMVHGKVLGRRGSI